ncbi:MAG: hypothetical protein CTY33_00130 [Methylotenera sp.]|nr:MAG: hypothetical protein CTY33_00130 [Methylotenera sp.]
MDNLLPCPFCGAEGRRFKTTSGLELQSHGVQCTGSTCHIVGPQMGNEHDAAHAWNTRQQLAEQTSAEPVAWKLIGTDGKRSAVTDSIENVAEAIKLNSVGREINVIPLYTAPPSVEVLLEALREIAFMGMDNAAGTDNYYFIESQLRLCVAKAALALNKYSNPITVKED